MRVRGLPIVALSWLLVACGNKSNESAPAPAPAPAADPAPEPVPDPAFPPPEPDPGLEEACAQVMVVSYQGADYAPADVTRTESEARARIDELRAKLDRGADFANLARTESDAASSGPRGGVIGTYAKDDWPLAHGVIRDAVFALAVGQVSDVVSADYGFVFARRCAVEKVHTRHVLIRHHGAKNAPDDLERGEEAARELAARVRTQVTQPGADFAAIAREQSEDGSAERGGDLGPVGRGLLAPEYEAAAFALQAGQVSDVVKTVFGFHVIQRVE